MLEFLSRFDFLSRFFNKKEETKKIAKERLRMVLIHDRTSVAPSFLEDLKADLLMVFNRYMEIDEKMIEIMFERQDGTVALAANIPILRMRRAPLPPQGSSAVTPSPQSREDSAQVEMSTPVKAPALKPKPLAARKKRRKNLSKKKKK